jgi:hypothetical protein
MSTTQKPKEVFREGAAEVKEKLRADISNWSKFRRFISLAPTMLCLDCEGTGRTHCTGCGGTGQQKLVWNDEISSCPTCQGSGSVTCVECIGKGRIPNKRRKMFLWLFAVGGLCWGYFLFRIWGGDVAPELNAKYLHGGGGGGGGQTQFAPRGGRSLQPPGQPVPAGQPDGSGANGQPAGGALNGKAQGNPQGNTQGNLQQNQQGAPGNPGGLIESPRGGQMRPSGLAPP